MFKLFLLVLTSIVSVSVSGQHTASCPFNPMCLCRWTDSRSTMMLVDVSCVNLPLYKIPALPHGRVINMEVSSTNIILLEQDSMAGLHLKSLKLSSNRIQKIHNKTFSSMLSSLVSLDLSFNVLREVPVNALGDLQTLAKLDLKGNQISSLSVDWRTLADTLTTLYLSNNDITDLARVHDVSGTPINHGHSVDHSLHHFKKLTSLDLSNNKITNILKHSLPNTLINIDLSNNNLHSIPCGIIDRLSNLQNAYFRGNFITSIPEYTFKHKRKLEKLDLGENELAQIPENMFNGSLAIRDLSLDFNYIEHLPKMAFTGLNSSRIILSNNQIQRIDDNSFVGLEQTLEYLDLDHNSLLNVSATIINLQALKYLYLSSNSISTISELPSTLKVLSLSGNSLMEIPSIALENCYQLTYLNLGYNQISEISPEDFISWGVNLETLLLRNNKISRLDADVFGSLVTLKELSLSFNDIHFVNPDAFINISNSLKILEMSFGLYGEDFPVDVLRRLKDLSYLALDNNNFRAITSDALSGFKNLVHLNLISNRIDSLPRNFLQPEVHTHLIDVELSYNSLEVIQEFTFNSLPNLQNVDLSCNNILLLEENSFYNLTYLIKLDLSNNLLSEIADDSFSYLPNLLRLDLSNNALKNFHLSSLYNVTNDLQPLTLNLSNNYLNTLTTSSLEYNNLFVGVLDLSYNRLHDVNVEFLNNFQFSLRRLYLGFNNMSKLENHAFGSLVHLQELRINNNNIGAIRRRSFLSLDNLKILDLGHNAVELLQSEQFSNLKQLRVLYLNNNNIRSLSRDVFQNTLIETLDLRSNEIYTLPNTALSEIGFTLRSIKASANRIVHLDPIIFMDTPYLLEIDISSNNISSLADNLFYSLGELQYLDLNDNPLTIRNSKEFCQYTQNLRTLNLKHLKLGSIPHMHLPQLRMLELGSNNINEISSDSLLSFTKLIELNLSNNKLSAVPTHLWVHVPNLKSLDLSRNPITKINADSYFGLFNLRTLNLLELSPDVEINSNCLSQIKLQYLSIESYDKNKIVDVISTLPNLEKIIFKINDEILLKQLKNIKNRKLKSIEIYGKHLSGVDVNAFSDFRNNFALDIKIKATMISDFPVGLFYQLRDVSKLTIDLRGNAITSVTPDAFYPNSMAWEKYGTKLISGGLLMSENPLQCDCGLVWLGHWLRRWLRETVQTQTVSVQHSKEMLTSARETTCLYHRTGRLTPLLELHPEDLFCHASALSSAGNASAILFTVFNGFLLILTLTALHVNYLRSVGDIVM